MAKLLAFKKFSEEYSNDYFVASKSLSVSASPQQIEYELTNDIGLLHQYFAGDLTKKSKHTDVLIARFGNLCIGGGSISFNTPTKKIADKRLLPLEKLLKKSGKNLANLLPELAIDDMICAEISALSVLPDYEGSEVLLNIMQGLIEHSIEQKAHFIFITSTLPLAHHYKKALSYLDLELEIIDNLVMPENYEFAGSTMVLSLLDLTPIYRLQSLSTDVVIQETEIFV